MAESTYQPQGYLGDNRPREIQMRNYPDNSAPPPAQQEQPPAHSLEPAKEEEPSMGGYLLHWLAFAIALGINIGIWAIDTYAIKRQYSYYYYNTITFAATIDAALYTSASVMFSPDDPNDTLGVAMGIIYGWVLWKAPLAIYMLHLTAQQEKKGLRIGSWVAGVVLLVAADVLLAIFAKSFYGDWIFFGIFILVCLLVSLINNAGISRAKEAILNTLIPLLLIAFIYCTYTLFLPKLYNVYSTNVSNAITQLFLIFYIYPAFDLIIYILVLLLGWKVEDGVKGFHSMIHFLMIGYGAGMIMLVGYTEVEFYYIIAYFIFRNVFVNHIMRRWERVVANPSALPGWGVAYYLGYALSFMPVVGLAGKLVISKSFRSYIFALTPTSLYGIANPLYGSKTAPTSLLTTNFSFDGNIYWLSGLLIWLAMTFSQKYERKAPKLYDFFYYVFGLQLFYIGIASALSMGTLSTAAHI